MADRGCSRYVADRIIYESINLFYATDHVRAEAWRNLLFEKMLTAARDWEQNYTGIDEETGKRTMDLYMYDPAHPEYAPIPLGGLFKSLVVG